jgi:hypothetical protein
MFRQANFPRKKIRALGEVSFLIWNPWIFEQNLWISEQNNVESDSSSPFNWALKLSI